MHRTFGRPSTSRAQQFGVNVYRWMNGWSINMKTVGSTLSADLIVLLLLLLLLRRRLVTPPFVEFIARESNTHAHHRVFVCSNSGRGLRDISVIYVRYGTRWALSHVCLCVCSTCVYANVCVRIGCTRGTGSKCMFLGHRQDCIENRLWRWCRVRRQWQDRHFRIYILHSLASRAPVSICFIHRRIISLRVLQCTIHSRLWVWRWVEHSR